MAKNKSKRKTRSQKEVARLRREVEVLRAQLSVSRPVAEPAASPPPIRQEKSTFPLPSGDNPISDQLLKKDLTKSLLLGFLGLLVLVVLARISLLGLILK